VELGLCGASRIAISSRPKADASKIDVQIVEGPNTGKWIRDQHLAGIVEVETP